MKDSELLKALNAHRAVTSEVSLLLQTYRDSEIEQGEDSYGTFAERIACACEDIVTRHRSEWESMTKEERKIAASQILSARMLFMKVVPEGYVSGYEGKVITEIPF